MNQTVRHAFRACGRQPAVTACAVIRLALGIGATTAIFSVVNAVLLRPLSYKDSGRLVWIWSVDTTRSLQQWVSYPDFLDWRARSRTLEHLSGWGGYAATLTGTGEPERLQAVVAMGDLFEVLGHSAGSRDSAGAARVSFARPVAAEQLAGGGEDGEGSSRIHRRGACRCRRD